MVNNKGDIRTARKISKKGTLIRSMRNPPPCESDAPPLPRLPKSISSVNEMPLDMIIIDPCQDLLEEQFLKKRPRTFKSNPIDYKVMTSVEILKKMSCQ